MAKQITAIRLSPPNSNDYTHITHVTWTDDGVYEQIVPREDVVGEINAGRRVIVQIGSLTVDVVIERVQGVDYIRTTPDHTQKDNLLNLPRC